MTAKPKTIAEAIAYLYGALDIASRPTSWVATALQVIEVETEKQAVQYTEMSDYATKLEKLLVEARRQMNAIPRAGVTEEQA